METTDLYFLAKLKSEFSQRQRRNPSYSLRAYAKDLEIDSSNLSAILREKRGLPSGRAQKIATKLNLSPKESAIFVSSTYRKKMNLDKIKVLSESKKYLLDEAYFQIISEWEHYAFLQLLKTEDFQHDIKWIANRFNITKKRVQEVLDNLLRLKMIQIDKDGKYFRSISNLETSEDIESKALQKSHDDCLDIAKLKLKEIAVQDRDYSSITFAIDPKKMPEAKAIIREFQDKLYSLMSNSETKEVYIFNSQLFPVSTLNKGKE